MLHNSSLSPAPIIAQVISPATILYIQQVYPHNGYVVENGTRGIGPPQPYHEFGSDGSPSRFTYAAYQEYHHPIFNEFALARSGLKRADIEAWLAVPGNDALTHPQYAPLCLRWGENTDGLYVAEYSLPNGNPEHQVEFTPFPCWQTGLTYYCLIAPLASDGRYAPEMQAQGILQEHSEEIGSEGDWHGWYSTDWAALQRTLSTYHLTPVLAQVVTEYWVGFHEREDEVRWVEHFYRSSEAEARYAQFPAHPVHDAFRTNEYPRLVKGGSSSVRDFAVDGWRSGEKVLASSASSSCD